MRDDEQKGERVESLIADLAVAVEAECRAAEVHREANLARRSAEGRRAEARRRLDEAIRREVEAALPTQPRNPGS